MIKLALAFTMTVAGLVHAADNSIDSIPRSEAISKMLGISEQLSHSETADVAAAISNKRLSKERLQSLLYDQVKPIREPIHLSTNLLSDPGIVKVTPTRPTTVSFFQRGNKKLKVLGTNIKQSENPRFQVKRITGLEYAYEFSTNVLDGWTTVDFFFEGFPNSIPIKIVAGTEYHSSAQAILFDDNDFVPNGSNSAQSRTSNADSASSTTNEAAEISRLLHTYAAYGKPPASSNKTDVEFFRSTSMSMPHVNVVKSTLGNEEYYLVRTNGRLRSPDYEFAEPAPTASEDIWVYAIPKRNVTNLIDISYHSGTHLLLFKEVDAVGLNTDIETQLR